MSTLQYLVKRVLTESTEIQVGDKVQFQIPYFETKLTYEGEVIQCSYAYCKVKYKSGGIVLVTELPTTLVKKKK